MSEASHEEIAFSSESQFSLVVETAMSVILQIVLAKKRTYYNKDLVWKHRMLWWTSSGEQDR